MRLSNELLSDSASAPNNDRVFPCADEEQERPLAKSKGDVDAATKIAVGLIAWIVAKTGWTADDMPAIQFIPHEELAKRYADGNTAAPRVDALYSDKDDTIYLPSGWNLHNLRDRSALLHELVHHLQMVNKVKVNCQAEYEWDAYKLQIAWLREKGVEDPLKLMGVDLMAIYVFSHCPEF